MTVEGYAKEFYSNTPIYDRYICVWFDDNKQHQTAKFEESVLELVKAS
jgi:uncharacterized protein YodC (DUF2158 family)